MDHGASSGPNQDIGSQVPEEVSRRSHRGADPGRLTPRSTDVRRSVAAARRIAGRLVPQ